MRSSEASRERRVRAVRSACKISREDERLDPIDRRCCLYLLCAIGSASPRTSRFGTSLFKRFATSSSADSSPRRLSQRSASPVALERFSSIIKMLPSLSCILRVSNHFLKEVSCELN